MQELNAEQTHLNHPYLDRDRELAKQRELLELQRKSIEIQLRTISVERIELEQKRKEINRVFHDLKHEFIILNPIGQFAGKDDECQAE